MYCVQPLCMPSRSSMITGMTPRGHGVWSNGLPLDPGIPTFSRALADSGYATALIGKAHFSVYDRYRGLAPGDSRETAQSWSDGSVTAAWQGPYYGFEHVELTLTHNSVAHGHIRADLEAGGDFADLTGIEHALVDPLWPGGWKSALPVEHHPTTWVAERSAEYLHGIGDRPFFLWASFPDPHHPFAPSGHYADLFDPQQMDLPASFGADLTGKPEHVRQYAGGELPGRMEGSGAGFENLAALPPPVWQQILAYYYGMCRHIDDGVGMILDALDRAGLAESTTVIFTSDHGELLGDQGLLYKGPYAYEGLQRVPFIARLPGAPTGATLPNLGSHIDLAPTFCDLAGIGVPDHMSGRPMTEWLSGGAGRDRVLIEFQGRYSPVNSRTLVTESHKLTRYAGGPISELYDLREDPNELNNLYRRPESARLRHELGERLLTEMLLAESCYPRPVVHA